MSKRAKLSSVERLLMRELRKHLPERAFVGVSYHRHLDYSYKSIRLGIKPSLSQKLSVRIAMPRDDNPHALWDQHEWSGEDLGKCVAAAAAWNRQREQLLALSASPAKALPSALPALGAGL